MSLAEQQAALVRALVARGEVPAGFDRSRVDATISALLRKRSGEVARLWPVLLSTPAARAAFRAWADGRPKTTSYRDGLAFARSLAAADLLPDGAAEELKRRVHRGRRSWRQLIMR